MDDALRLPVRGSLLSDANSLDHSTTANPIESENEVEEPNEEDENDNTYEAEEDDDDDITLELDSEKPVSEKSDLLRKIEEDEAMVKYMREKYPKETQDLSDRNVLVWRELSIVNIRVKYPEDTNWMFDDAVLEWKGLFDEDETKPYLEPFEDLKPIEPETTNSSGAMPGEAPMESSVVQGQTDSTNEDFNDAYALEASDQSNEPSAGTIQDNQVGGSERNDDAPPSYDSVDSNQENVGHQNEHAASTGGNINEGTAPSPSTPPNQLVLRHRSPPSPNFGPGRSIIIRVQRSDQCRYTHHLVRINHNDTYQNLLYRIRRIVFPTATQNYRLEARWMSDSGERTAIKAKKREPNSCTR